MNLNHLFDVRLAETDLMICETDSKGRDNPQLQRIMQVIMKDDAWRKKLTEKTLAFEKYYPVMVRSGFICMMVIPLVFLILMFSLESKPGLSDFVDRFFTCTDTVSADCGIST